MRPRRWKLSRSVGTNTIMLQSTRITTVRSSPTPEHRLRCVAIQFTLIQWRRQRSKGARSFRGQKILQPGHPDALFSSEKVGDLF